MQDLDFIKNFSKITITSACKKTNVDRASLLTNRVRGEKVKLVREEIESEIAKLYIKEEK